MLMLKLNLKPLMLQERVTRRRSLLREAKVLAMGAQFQRRASQCERILDSFFVRGVYLEQLKGFGLLLKMMTVMIIVSKNWVFKEYVLRVWSLDFLALSHSSMTAA